MKKYALIIFCAFVKLIDAQTYVAFVPCLTNAVGSIQTKFSPTIEVGRQWDVLSLGFDIGKTNCSRVSGKDTSVYFEFRPNLNIFQVGKFTNTFTPGIGFVVGANSLMLEMTSGIEYAFTEKVHVNMFYGQYFYSGMTSSSSVSFFGISVVRFFLPYKPSSIIKQNGKS
jgi:hypothetical protein